MNLRFTSANIAKPGKNRTLLGTMALEAGYPRFPILWRDDLLRRIFHSKLISVEWSFP